MISGQVQLVVNTTSGAQSLKDSFDIRRTALTRNISHYTTLTGAEAAVSAIGALTDGGLDVAPLQSYFKR
jgi:carbamoyl-phosphate synthase large subunit